MAAHPIKNKQIADILREIGLMLEADRVEFKPQAYERAAEVVETLDQELVQLYRQCGPTCIEDLPGIGESITEKIAELVTTGRLHYYTDLKKRYPFNLLELTSLQGVGTLTAVRLYRALKVKNIRDLERVAKAGKIRSIKGFGRKTEDAILRSLGFLREHEGRFRLHDILPIAESIVERLRNLPGVTHCDVAGSIRRRKETIGDIDILITTSEPDIAIETFKTLPEISEVLEEGPTKVVVRYRFGTNGDLRILKPEEYGSALVHFTGSKEHNIQIRELAHQHGLKLSEYGLFRGTKRIACRVEEEVYAWLKMEWVPPEMREATGEVKLALAHNIPSIIPYGSIKGDLQVQTNWTDGSHSIEDMARAAQEYGLEYIAITDHTQSLTIASGLNETQLAKQGKEIDALNKKLKGFRILKSTECDIRKDGSLDLADAALKKLDLVSVSIHTYFDMSEDEMTERVIRALKHPLVNIFFHPTGRIVNARAGYKVDMGRIIRAAKEFGVALEVNGSERLDLRDTHIRAAVEEGVKLVVNSDGHAPDHFRYLDLGISQARRGWAKKSDILNTKPVDTFLKTIAKTKKPRS